MKEYDLNKLIDNPHLVEENITDFFNKNILKLQKLDPEEIKGHLRKAEHNLRFVSDNFKLHYFDWAITGCYYASYHAALALILTKGYSSKNHFATLCILIKEFYRQGLTKEDLEILSHFLDYQDVLFYVESKNKREDATYSTNTKFDQRELEQLRVKSVLSKIEAQYLTLESEDVALYLDSKSAVF